MEGPTLLAGRWCTTRQGSQPRFLLPIELAVPILPFGPVLQGGLNSLGGCAFAQSFDRGTAHLNGFGDLGISPLRSLGAGICLQEDAGPREGPCRSLPFLDGLVQEEAFGIGEGDHVQLGHWGCSSDSVYVSRTAAVYSSIWPVRVSFQSR